MAGGGTWDPEGVVRVIWALREAGVTAFRLSVASAGIELELRRDTTGKLVPAEPSDTPPSPADPGGAPAEGPSALVRAPVLGVFYRRAAPDRPPLAAPGDRVVSGQPLGVIEVMKTYHEVTAPRAGVLAEFLVEDAAFVEYGAPIARLREEG